MEQLYMQIYDSAPLSELTTLLVLWRNPDTRTIPTQTENVAVQFGLRASFSCIALV